MRLDFDYPLFAYSSDGSKVTLPTDLKQLDGYQSKESDSNLAAHMDPPLSRKISKGHKMSLHLVGGDLTARFSFHIVDEAEDELISELSEFVHGQILDGFGEGCYYLPHKTKIRQISYLAFPSAPDLAVPERVNDGKKIRHPAPSKRLIWAAEDGDLDQIRSAVSGGQKLDVKGQWSTTPLSIAVRNKHVECVRVLLEGGAHIALPLYDTVESTCPVQQNAMTGTYLLDWKKRQGLSPNAPVIFEDDRAIEIAKLLLKHGADFNRKITGHYDRPLQWALNRDSWKLAEFYIHNGADPNYRHPHADRTLLMEFPQIECAKLLVRNGLDLAHKNTDGQTTLEFIQSRLVKLEKDRQNHSDKKIQNLKEIIQILQ